MSWGAGRGGGWWRITIRDNDEEWDWPGIGWVVENERGDVVEEWEQNHKMIEVRRDDGRMSMRSDEEGEFFVGGKWMDGSVGIVGSMWGDGVGEVLDR